MSSSPTTYAAHKMLEPSSVNNAAKDAGVTGTISATTSGTCAPTTASANEMIIVGIAISSAVYVSSVADTHSLTWKKLCAYQRSTTLRAELWGAIEPTAQTHTVTVTLSASGSAVMVAGSFSGLNSFASPASAVLTVFPVDPGSKNSASGSSTSAAVTNTTTNPQDMLITFLAALANPTLSGLSGTTVSSAALSTTVTGAMQYQALSAASTSNAQTYTLGTSEAWIMLSIALMSSGNNTMLIQASSSQEFILKNVFYSGACVVAKTDGYTPITLFTPIQSGSHIMDSFQETPSGASIPSLIEIVNTSLTSAIDVGYDGVRSQ